VPLGVRVAAPAQAQLGEAPGWDGALECLHWVDITAGEVHRYRPGQADEVIASLDVTVAAALPRAGGGLVLAAGMGIAFLDEEGRAAWKATTTAGDRMNEAKCDPAGRLFAGTMTYDRRPDAALFRVEDDWALTPVLTGVRLSNGMGWSPDGERFYYIDTPTRRVDVFDYDLSSGRPTGRRLFADIGDMPGNPDGLAVDDEGGVWVVLARGSSVRRFDPGGRLDEVVDLPVTRATSCAFGGPAGDELYVTTGRFDLTDAELGEQQWAGSLLVCRPGVTGRPVVPFPG
jgi:sugar lactone lactonase YvrE